MLICGIDPGLGMTGVAVWDTGDEKFVAVEAFASDSSDETSKRLCMLAEGAAQAWAAYGIDMVAIEDNHVTVGKSAQSALKQREVIGAISARAIAYPQSRIAPTTAKKVFTGSGKATKDQMVEVARRYVDLDGYNKAQREAIADAMGVAMAGADAAKKEAA